ncbi:MAG: VTT domain-containing protein [Anaerolineae bacterium]
MGRIRGQTIAILGLLALVIAALLIWHKPLLSFFADRAKVQEFVIRFGPWAPLSSILLHMAQVLLAPIPGQVIDVVNGYLFGTVWGTVYSLVGVIAGSSVAMALARRFGRPWAERLVKRETLERIDGYSRQRGALFFFLVFLFPFLPDDVACFLAGLTLLPLPELIVLATIGRLPGILVANFVGANAAALTQTQAAFFIIVLATIALAFWRYQERVEATMLEATMWLSDKLKAVR